MSEEPVPRPPPPGPADPSAAQRARLVRVGGPVRDSKVGLRLFGEDLDPDEVTRLLGCLPTLACRKGDVIPDPKYHRIERSGKWILHSGADRATPLEEQVDRLLSRVTADPSVWRDLGGRFKVDLFCGVFLDEANRGFDLGPDLLRRMGERGLRIGFDIYAPRGGGER